MNAVTIDTLKLARSLREQAKLSPEQAEGFAAALAEALQGDLATKGDVEALGRDLREVELTLKADIRQTEQRLKADIEQLEQRLKAETESLRQQLKAGLQETEARLQARIDAGKIESIKWKWTAGLIGFESVAILGTLATLLGRARL